MNIKDIQQINAFPEVAVANKFPLLPLGSELSGNRYLTRGKNGNVPFTTAFGNLSIAWHGIQCKSFRKKTIDQEI